MFKVCVVLSDPTFRVNMQKQEKRCIFGIFRLSKEIYEIEQANNRYVHTVDTVSNHLIIIRPLAHFFY